MTEIIHTHNNTTEIDMTNAINNKARNQGFRKDEQGRIVWTGNYAGLVRTYVVVNADGSATAINNLRKAIQ